MLFILKLLPVNDPLQNVTFKLQPSVSSWIPTVAMYVKVLAYRFMSLFLLIHIFSNKRRTEDIIIIIFAYFL